MPWPGGLDRASSSFAMPDGLEHLLLQADPDHRNSPSLLLQLLIRCLSRIKSVHGSAQAAALQEHPQGLQPLRTIRKLLRQAGKALPRQDHLHLGMGQDVEIPLASGLPSLIAVDNPILPGKADRSVADLSRLFSPDSQDHDVTGEGIGDESAQAHLKPGNHDKAIDNSEYCSEKTYSVQLPQAPCPSLASY